VIVYFLRHASAGQSTPDPEADARRPLDDEGIEQCALIGQALAASGSTIDEIISSPLKRAAQTASLTAKALGYKREIQYSSTLAKETNLREFVSLLREHSDRKAIMVVGHNPSLSQYLSLIVSGGANDAGTELKKAAIARVEIDAKARQGVLHWCVTPKLVRSVQEATTNNSRPKTSRK
jgi:phosphohistidine phosphatase